MAFFLCTYGDRNISEGSSFYEDINPMVLEPYPYDLMQLFYSIKALSLNTVTLRGRASLREFGENTVQSITSDKRRPVWDPHLRRHCSGFLYLSPNPKHKESSRFMFHLLDTFWVHGAPDFLPKGRLCLHLRRWPRSNSFRGTYQSLECELVFYPCACKTPPGVGKHSGREKKDVIQDPRVWS
jgi:hypothetical protein